MVFPEVVIESQQQTVEGDYYENKAEGTLDMSDMMLVPQDRGPPPLELM